MEKKDYPQTLMCSNCGRVEVRIPRGVTVADYLKENNPCPRCGNKTLGEFPKVWR